MPYKRTSQSSGIIGYASQFSVPVLMPKKGLLKRLVRLYGLGYLYGGDCVDGLADAIRKRLNSNSYERPTTAYCVDHKFEAFSRSINNLIYENIC